MSQGIHTARTERSTVAAMRPTGTAARLLAIAAALLLAFVALFASASPAAAHDELIGSDPAADSTVDALPAQLTLTFSAAIAPDEGASEVEVTDASGTSLVDGAPSAQDNVLTQPLAGEASGAVTVLWKVVSSDGHPISGEFTFSVAAAPEPTPTETTEPTPTATTEPTPTPTTEPTPTPTTEPTPTPTAPPADEDSTFADVWPWVIGGLLFAAVGGAVVYLLVSRARREKALAEAHGESPGTGSEPGSGTPADQ